jgi:hypothetical protein
MPPYAQTQRTRATTRVSPIQCRRNLYEYNMLEMDKLTVHWFLLRKSYLHGGDRGHELVGINGRAHFKAASPALRFENGRDLWQQTTRYVQSTQYRSNERLFDDMHHLLLSCFRERAIQIHNTPIQSQREEDM